MSAPPFMQLYVGDYLSDTLALTTEQHGAYLLLLMTMWRANGRLQNDPAKLARIARVTPKRWPQVWAAISDFFDIDGDEITNQRLGTELQKAVQISQERKNAGKKGGTANALKTKKPTEANASAGLKHSQISDIKKENSSLSISCAFEPEKASRFADFWAAYPHRDGKRGRKPAEAKYARIVASGIPEQTIIDGAVRYATDRRVLSGYARDPTTWLNQAGWEDEIETGPVTTKGRSDDEQRFGATIHELSRRLSDGTANFRTDDRDPFAPRPRQNP